MILAATLYCLAIAGSGNPLGYTCPMKYEDCQWFKRAVHRAGVEALCLPIGPKEKK